MTYDQLVAFLAVVRAGAFTGASSLLHKSQPAVSKLVRNLEEELGVALFDRSQYRATLTDAGRLFHERALAVIESSEALRAFGRQLGGSVEPIVRLAIEAVTPLAPVMRTLRVMQTNYPTVRFELSTERLAGAVDALRDGRAHLVVATKLGIEGVPLERVPFGRVAILPVVRAGHPLADAPAPVSGALARAYPQIVLRDSAQSSDGPSLNVLDGGLRWTVTDVAAKKEVILAGMGWGGLPAHVVADAVASGELVVLHVAEFDTDAMELFVMRRRDRPHGVVASAVWDHLRQPREPKPSSPMPPARRSQPVGRSAPTGPRVGRRATRRRAR